MEFVFLSVEVESHILISEQIGSEVLTLFANPGQRQTSGQMNICFTHAIYIQLSGNCHQSQKIIVLVHCLVRDKFLVSLADAVIGSFIFQNIAGKDWFCVIGSDSGRCDSVCSFDVAIAVIHGDDFDVFQFFHLLSSSLKFLINIKNALLSVDLLSVRHQF